MKALLTRGVGDLQDMQAPGRRHAHEPWRATARQLIILACRICGVYEVPLTRDPHRDVPADLLGRGGVGSPHD